MAIIVWTLIVAAIFGVAGVVVGYKFHDKIKGEVEQVL